MKTTVAKKLTTPLVVSLFCVNLVSVNAYADGLADLKAALTQLKGNTPVSAKITNRFEQARGSGDDIEVKKGEVTVRASDNESGLSVLYDASILQLMDEEAKAKAEDEEAQTPTLMGLNNNMGTMDMRLKFSSAAHLEKRLLQASFLSEESLQRDGLTLRKLHFELPIDAIISDKTTRKYVDKFDASYNIIIDQAGFPVESEMSFKGRGRAYIVLSVKAEVSSRSTYQVHGERLLQISNDYRGKFTSSLWPDSEYFGGHELELLDTVDELTKH